MALEKERAWYKANKADLLAKHRGKWIVVHKDKLIGVYDNSVEAYNNWSFQCRQKLMSASVA